MSLKPDFSGLAEFEFSAHFKCGEKFFTSRIVVRPGCDASSYESGEYVFSVADSVTSVDVMLQ